MRMFLPPFMFAILALALPRLATGSELPQPIAEHLRNTFGNLPVRDAEDAFSVYAPRKKIDPERTCGSEFERVLPDEKEIKVSERITLRIAPKSPGDLIAYISGNPEPFWFHLKYGRQTGRGIQVSSGLSMRYCGRSRNYHRVYIFQVKEKELLAWQRDVDSGTVYCEEGP